MERETNGLKYCSDFTHGPVPSTEISNEKNVIAHQFIILYTRGDLTPRCSFHTDQASSMISQPAVHVYRHTMKRLIYCVVHIGYCNYHKQQTTYQRIGLFSGTFRQLRKLAGSAKVYTELSKPHDILPLATIFRENKLAGAK